VADPGQRCYQHDGKDPIKAAADIAAELRERQRAGRRARPSARRPEPDVPMSDEQLAALAECLNRHGVDYLLVGGAAAQLHGAPVPRTRDADIVPSRKEQNLNRLAAALDEMQARLWVGQTEPHGLAMPFDRRTLGQVEGFLNLVTRHGPLDITYQPEGTEGYDDLATSVVVIRLLGVDVPVAALEDVVRSKEAAGRAKDLAVLPELIQHLRRREGGSRP
jgi:hypothetical protein